MNLAWQSEFMWDGAIKHLDLQSLAPLTHRTEMNMSIDSILLFLKNDPGYQRAFGKREISIPNMLKAFAQFEMTLISRGSRYDSMKRKQVVFTDQEHRGYQLFQKNCGVCHSEPLFSMPGTFASNGLQMDSLLHDKGRAEISGKPEDYFLFKIPSLRNVEATYPYMHDGRMKTLTEVVKYYSDRTLLLPKVLGGGQHVIVLNSKERVDLLAFLMTLTDPGFLQNPSFQEPR
jgi:cytochrome c peroxidase